MSITDDDLEAAILFPAVATAMVEIVKRCHYPMRQFAFLEKERLRQQERANKEAVERCNAEERADRLAALLKEIRWDLGDVDGLLQDEYNCLLRRIDDALAAHDAHKQTKE